ncbi:carbohydrate binding domain-containing protein, partial [Lentisalinibacter salinarum]|uniref:carbohydrate binding domain-containing protein n=1 Tax=Lentisalinibacter salinarum TaxID=2992239 RepID=UPI0038646CA4
MHASASTRSFRTLALIASALLLAACGQGDGPDSISNEPVTPLPPSSGDPFDSGLLTNGDFEAGVDPWIGNAANVVDDGGDLVNFADITAAGQPFDVNLSQVVAITEGETYTLTFEARSDRARTMLAGIGLNVEPFTNITQTVNLTTDWQTFQFDITATGFGGADSRVLFDMGADIGQVLIDDVSLTVAGPGGSDPSIDPDAALFTSAGDPDLVIPDDYLERTTFGSGSIIDPAYADDETYSPVLSVFSGTGYGANVAQVGFIGFPEGFLTQYATVDFKVKGMPGFVIFVKLFDGVDALRLNLTSSDYSAELENGWFQVSIPVADFSGAAEATGIVIESDDTSPTEFRMLLNDIGFSGAGDFVPADPGIIPEVTLYDRDGMPDLVIPDDYAEISVFGSDAVIDDDFRGDLDFSPALAITTGFGYDVWNAQLAYLGFDPGFAAGYETLDFKVKGLSGGVIRVKFPNDPDPPYLDINVTTSAFATDLGNGWYQVSVPVTEFEGVATATDLLFETIAPAPAESFTYLLTDVGFSGDVPVDTTTSVDFEGDTASLSFDNFGGGESTVIANPDQSGINTSAQVVQMTRTSESDFGGSTLALPDGVDWSQGEVFRMKVWSQREVPVLFKVEGTPPAEQSDTHDGGSLWQELCFDFTDNNAGPPVTGISIFFDLGAVGDVANDPDNWTFYYDDIQQTTEPCPVPPPEPGDHGPGTAGVFTETTTESTITVTSITNSIDFGGNNTVADPASTAIPAFEGDVVLSIDYQDSGSTFGGAVLNFGGVDLTAYDTLNFTIDTSGIAGFADLTIQIEPPGAGAAGTNVALSSYTPVATSGNWATYAIPLADFTATDFSAAANLGFWNPTDGSGLAFGTLYVDDVYFSTEGGSGTGDHGPGTAGVFTETTTESTIAVTSITNSIDFGGNNTVADPTSTAIPAFEGDVVLAIDYQNSGSTFGGILLNFGGVDLTAYDTLNFTVDTSGIAGFADLTIQIEPPGAGAAGTNVALSSYTPVATSGNWATYAIPLADFTATDFSAAANLGFWNPIDGTSGLAFGTLYVDDVYFSTEGGGGGGGGGGGATGELTVNGDFETGDLTGWETFANGGTITTTGDSSGGSFAANMNVTIPGNPTLKQSNLAAGDLTPGQQVTVSFDWKGTDANGGVVDVVLFSELSGGGVSQTDSILSGGGFPADWTTVGPLTITLGPDVSGGITLQFTAICGGAAGCVSDIYIDNVSIISGDAPVDTTTSVDFEGDTTSLSFDNFGGGESTVIANPDPSGINTSGQVVQMTKTSASDFGGSTLALPEGVDWSQGEIFRMKVWSQREVPVLFKVEGTPAVERDDTHDGGSVWQELCFDFTGDNAGPPVTGISIFFDLGAVGDLANNPDDWTFYYDDIEQTSEPCPVPPPPAPEFTTITFDDPATTYTLTDFGGTASTVTNDPAGGANQVVLTVKSDTAQVWAGTTVSTLPGEAVPVIPLAADNTQMSVRVYSPDAGIPVRLKIEDASDPAIAVETEAVTTTVNAWETLTFDFANEAAGPPFNPAATYSKVSIFFNFGTDGATAGEKTYYFDDIAVGPGDAAPGGGELLTNGDFEASAADKAPWVNAGGVVTNNFYTADALDGQQVFDTNL